MSEVKNDAELVSLSSLKDSEIRLLGRRLFSTPAHEKAMAKAGFTLEAVYGIAKKWLDIIDKEISKPNGRDVSKDLWKLLEFLQNWTFHSERIGLEEKQYGAALSVGGAALLSQIKEKLESQNGRNIPKTDDDSGRTA